MDRLRPIVELRKVRFSLRPMLLVVAWLAIVLATFAYVGLFYAITLGAMYGLAIYLADQLLRQWATLPTDHRLLLVGALGLVLVGTVLGVIRMVNDAQSFVVLSRELEAEIHNEARFANVTARYSGSASHLVLTLGGRVASPEDLADLKELAADHYLEIKCTVVWRVEIMPAGAASRVPISGSNTAKR